MKLLCLDLSTKTGWSLIDDGKLIKYGNVVHKIDGDEKDIYYPMNYISTAKMIAKDIVSIIMENTPDIIIIEETNKGKNRYSQKILEFIHYAVNTSFVHCPRKIIVKYLDTSEWRALLDLSLSKDQRGQNKEVYKQRNDVRKELETQFDNNNYQHLSLINSCIKKRKKNKELKEYVKIRKDWVTEKLRPFRSKLDGKMIGKINMKTLSVNYVNNHFNMKFKKKDNDITDSICLGLAFIKKVANI